MPTKMARLTRKYEAITRYWTYPVKIGLSFALLLILALAAPPTDSHHNVTVFYSREQKNWLLLLLVACVSFACWKPTRFWGGVIATLVTGVVFVVPAFSPPAPPAFLTIGIFAVLACFTIGSAFHTIKLSHWMLRQAARREQRQLSELHDEGDF